MKLYKVPGEGKVGCCLGDAQGTAVRKARAVIENLLPTEAEETEPPFLKFTCESELSVEEVMSKIIEDDRVTLNDFEKSEDGGIVSVKGWLTDPKSGAEVRVEKEMKIEGGKLKSDEKIYISKIVEGLLKKAVRFTVQSTTLKVFQDTKVLKSMYGKLTIEKIEAGDKKKQIEFWTEKHKCTLAE